MFRRRRLWLGWAMFGRLFALLRNRATGEKEKGMGMASRQIDCRCSEDGHGEYSPGCVLVWSFLTADGQFRGETENLGQSDG